MKKVLVIEDNELNMKFIREVLRRRGYPVIEAFDGADGVALAEQNLPELILMDINMPHMGGVAALKKIRQIAPLSNTPVVALTAYAMEGDRERFIKEGFSDYIAKPISIGVLMETIERLLK
ncbi:MAG: response regulator [Nitrospirae bacterium]|nr:response regulator [Nitrospirota bacterium]